MDMQIKDSLCGEKRLETRYPCRRLPGLGYVPRRCFKTNPLFEWDD